MARGGRIVHAHLMELLGVSQSAIATLIAALLGAAIGAEREYRRHPGGLRSSALVAAAASVFARIAVAHGGDNPGAALGAIATGVGFLGAGVILHQGAQVRGLSTAATFWAVAAIGTAAGVLEYTLALGLFVIVMLAHVALRPLSAWIERVAPPEDPGPR
jgi:putative Mg2+ transporter-C (MgtC) family protein